MLLTFLVDQIQGMTCGLFQAAKKQAGSFRGLWEETRTLFKFMEWLSWEKLYRFMIARRATNTS